MITTNAKEFEKELIDLCEAFFPEKENMPQIFHEQTVSDKLINSVTIDGQAYKFEYALPTGSELKQKSLRKRYGLLSLYKAISKKCDMTLPWGSFTGIRPTALAREAVESGEIKEYAVTEFLQREFMISHDKAVLASKVIKNQKGIIRNDHLVDFYVNIPVCPTRCAYCSFISSELKAVKNILPTYLEALVKEIKAMKKLIFEKALIVRNIYVGGGTPTVLTPEELDLILNELSFPVNEFTVECGRPDTITREKLDVLEKHGVNRICINPQTFSDSTLKKIGRAHTKNQVFEAYGLALEKGFKVNMDIIIGLPGEKTAAINKNINTLLELCPNNITVHTLSVKNGSLFKDSSVQLGFKNLSKMLTLVENKLMDFGYKPYYLYRQKHQLGGLENVGFFRDNDICQFNIDSMEETSSIIAVGANAISKRVFSIERRIERQPNVKFLQEYIQRIDEMIERKKKLFDNV